MPAKRFEPDIYKDRKKLKVSDFLAGFLCGLIFWILSFWIAWYVAPLIIAALCAAGLFSEISPPLFYLRRARLDLFSVCCLGDAHLVLRRPQRNQKLEINPFLIQV